MTGRIRFRRRRKMYENEKGARDKGRFCRIFIAETSLFVFNPMGDVPI